MLLNFWFSSLIIAGISVLWRAIRMRHAPVVKFFRSRLGFFAPSFLCGFCFTYWTAFFFLLLYNPLQGWQLPLRYPLAPRAAAVIFFLASWMALGFVAVTFRFLFVLLKESVDHFTHHINPTPNHTHAHHH